MIDFAHVSTWVLIAVLYLILIVSTIYIISNAVNDRLTRKITPYDWAKENNDTVFILTGHMDMDPDYPVVMFFKSKEEAYTWAFTVAGDYHQQTNVMDIESIGNDYEYLGKVY
jgi:hypothetical protein